MLLIAGSGASMDWWPPELCHRLAAGGRRVVRYDHRDTGQSVTYPPGEPGYTGADLSDDAIGVLDALEIERADLVGISAGGGIAQEIAIEHPERVASITLIATAFADRPIPDIPFPDGVEPYSFDLPDPDWTDREAVIDYLTAFELAMASPARGDETAAPPRRRGRRSRRRHRRGREPRRHGARRLTGRLLDDVDLPALVVHGADDPLWRSATVRRSPPPSREPAC